MKYAMTTLVAAGGLGAAVAFAAPLNDKKPEVLISPGDYEACEGEVVTISGAALDNGAAVECGRISIQRNVDGVWNNVGSPVCSSASGVVIEFDTAGLAGECIEFRTHFAPGGGSGCDGCKGAYSADNSETITICIVKCVADEGCGVGYWKNHTDAWADTDYSVDQTIGAVFSGNLGGISGDVTLHAALDLGPQSGVDQARRNLLRHAVAAILNATHEIIAYPLEIAEVLALINDALDSDDADEMEALKDELEEMNENGCPL